MLERIEQNSTKRLQINLYSIIVELNSDAVFCMVEEISYLQMRGHLFEA